MSSIAIAKALREHARRLSLDHTDGTVSAEQLRNAATKTQPKPDTIVEEDESIPDTTGPAPKCYKCGETGHYAYDCQVTPATSTTTSTTTTTPTAISTSSPTSTSTPTPTPTLPLDTKTIETKTSPPEIVPTATVAEHINLSDLSLDSDNDSDHEPLDLYNDISRSASENDEDDDEDDGLKDSSTYGKSLSELYATHRLRMEELKTKLIAADQQTGDDVWLLRYVLSFESVDEAVVAASLSNGWRAQSGIAEMIEEVTAGTFFKSELSKHVHKYLCCGDHGTMSQGGGPVFIVRAGLSRPSLLMDRLTKADVSYYLLAQREHMFQRCDAETRRTQTLVKGTMIIDLANASLAEIWNESRFRDVNAAVSQLSGSLYPQMTYRTVVVHPPSYFGWLYGVVSRLVSIRLTKKIVIVPTTDVFAESSFALAHLNSSEIPTFLGGPLQNFNVQPELTGDMVDLEDEWYRELVVGAMSKRAVRMTVPVAGTILRHTMSVASWDIKCTVTLHKGDVTVVEWEDSDGTPHLGTKFSSNGEQQVLIDDVMIFSKNGALTDTTIVPDCGQLVIEFDNSYSFVTSKTVKYRFDSMGGGDGDDGGTGKDASESAEHKN
jgi:hypothetical protein